MKSNWLKLKVEAMKQMTTEQISNLEYREDSVYNQLQKSAKAIYVKEQPFVVVEKIIAWTNPDGSAMTEK
jgi:hypothetical protein